MVAADGYGLACAIQRQPVRISDGRQRGPQRDCTADAEGDRVRATARRAIAVGRGIVIGIADGFAQAAIAIHRRVV